MILSKEVSLLAPVPIDHLEESLPLATEAGKAAFGSNAWEVFRELDSIRVGEPVRVLIYASHPKERVGPRVTWVARYVGYVESVGGAHPDGDRYRSPIAAKEDSERFWAGFWEVEDLAPLAPDAYIAISDLRGWKKQAHFKTNFVPEGPILIDPTVL